MYWDKITFHHSGPNYLDNLLLDIQNAQTSIKIEVYIFDICEPTLKLLQALAEARGRGCHVQLLVDGFGSYSAIPRLQQICQKDDLELRIYRPLPGILLWIRRYFLPLSLGLFKTLRRLHRRNHRKLILVDDRTAYVGSMNLTSVHFYFAFWRDTCVRVEGPPVQILQDSFHLDWQRSRRPFSRTHWPKLTRSQWKTRHSVPDIVRINTSKWSRYQNYRRLIRSIRRSKSRIRILTAYFLPRSGLLRALKKAARRGVAVEIIIPGVSDVPLVKLAGLMIAEDLIAAGAKIYEYQPTVLHAKITCIDQWLLVGSANLNHRSLLHDLELEVGFWDPDSLREFDNQWKADLQNSRAFFPEEHQHHPLWLRILSRIAFRLRYFM